ncbi:MAG: patatin-like phospholipase family protein [Bacteriovoracia bacterium]
MQKRIEISPKKKIAFVCSGGATKAGAFHLGVALALKEQGFKFQGGLATPGGEAPLLGPKDIATYVGSSAGSIICSYLAAGFSLDNIFNSFLNRQPTDPADATPKVLPPLTYSVMFKLRRELAGEQLKQLKHWRDIAGTLMRGDWQQLVEMRWLKTTGIFSTAGLEQYLREDVLPSNRFSDYRSDLFVVGTQLNHTHKVVFGKYGFEPPPHDPDCLYKNDVPISQACAASTALPFVYSPYPIKTDSGRVNYYIDGEIRDTLSTHVAADAGADLIFASYTHQPYHYNREVGSLTELGLPTILIQSIYLVVEQKVNNYIHSKKVQRNAIDAVSSYCRQQGLDDNHRRRICEILENELHHRMNVDTIYIHPRANDTKMFTSEHFNLSAKKMTEVVRSGFKAAIDVLRRYRFN